MTAENTAIGTPENAQQHDDTEWEEDIVNATLQNNDATTPDSSFLQTADLDESLTHQEGSPTQEQVDDNVKDMIQAVDDLLLNMERDASTNNSATTPSRTSSDSISVAATDADATITTPTSTPSKPQKPRRSKSISKLQLRQRLQKASLKLKKSLNPINKKVVQPVARASVKASRRIITGDQTTRIRDYVVLPKVVKVLDKYTFTNGVMGMLLTEYIMLVYPEWFRYYNVLTMLPLLLLRVVLFRRTKQQYFLLDYCYWVNGLGFILTILPPMLEHYVLPALHGTSSVAFTPLTSTLQLFQDNQETLWQIFFISANGPLFFAMIAWNNSLVFHSVDKVTSTYVHLFPALLCWCERWHSPTSPIYYQVSTLGWTQHLGFPLAFYTLWQIVYLIQTEWWHKPVLDADPDLSTSLRYISSADKMAINRKTLQLCRTIGLMAPTETFHPPTLKVKTIFVILQMIMTTFTFLPVGLFYATRAVHTSVVLGILTFSVYNGARYYIQVFSKIYDKRYDDGGTDDDYVDTSAVMTEHRDSDITDTAGTAGATDDKKKTI